MIINHFFLVEFNLVDFVYNYCTDYIINLANLTGLSYYEINAIFFFFGLP